jgi:choline dehydrogenase-like flavoprotein
MLSFPPRPIQKVATETSRGRICTSCTRSRAKRKRPCVESSIPSREARAPCHSTAAQARMRGATNPSPSSTSTFTRTKRTLTSSSKVRPTMKLTHKVDFSNIGSFFAIYIFAGIKFCQRVVETRAFQKVGARLDTQRIDEYKKFRGNSDDYWRCYIRQHSHSVRHAGGGCRMGKSGDKKAVVDSQMK